MWPAPKAFKVPLKNLEAEVKLNKAQLTEGATLLMMNAGKWKPVAVEERRDYYYRG
jgi:LEA14-like dessication related protein